MDFLVGKCHHIFDSCRARAVHTFLIVKFRQIVVICCCERKS